MARTNRPDEAYHIPTLNVWFALSGVALFVTSVWMVMAIADYNRSWKDVQRDYRELERVRLSVERERATGAIDEEALEALKGGLTKAEAGLQTKSRDLADQRAKLAILEQKTQYTAKQAYNFKRAELIEQRYALETFRRDHPDRKGQIDQMAEAFRCNVWLIEGGDDPGHCPPREGPSLKEQFRSKDEELFLAQEAYDAMIADSKAAELAITEMRKTVLTAQKELDKIEASFFNETFRDAPLLDFMRPSLKIEQVVVTDIRDDYNFASVQKEDRCMTCHLGISSKTHSVDPNSRRFVTLSTRVAMEGDLMDAMEAFVRLKAGENAAEYLEELDSLKNEPDMTYTAWLDENFEDEAITAAFFTENAEVVAETRHRTQLYMAHPSLDLYMTSASPHPIEQFGCSVCHEGRGHATEFGRAYHTPTNEEDEARWVEEYDWDRPHYWDYPQLPKNRVVASCAKCHDAEPTLTGADKLNQGKKLVMRYGCYGCHRIEGFSDTLREAGPGLEKIASKIDRNFAYSWIWNPKHFRTSTKMPRFFEQSNNSWEPWLERSQQEVRGVVAYLWANQDPYESPEAPEGDAVAGETLFEEVGCLGCHSVESAGQTVNDHGPDLSGIGSKLGADFLFGWLKNPRNYFARTHMPSLRLSDQEAANIVAYLVSQKKDGWKPLPTPARNEAIQKSLLVEYLESAMRPSELEALLKTKSPDELEVVLGSKAIGKYGCTGCHAVKGFEDAGPIGTELSLWGDKFLTQLDFALHNYHGSHAEIDHTKLAWATQKLGNPRSWDRGMIETKAYKDLLRMPNFGFTEDQVDALVTFLISRRQQKVVQEKRPKTTIPYNATQAGRLLVAQYNCQGCHYFDSAGGGLALYWKLDSAGEAQFQTVAGRDDFSYLEHVPGPVRGRVPPLLLDQGNKTQAPWLFDFLINPSTKLRPLLKMRMPTFQLTDDEANTLVRMFAGLEGHDIGDQTTFEPDPDLALIGAELFTRGKCTACHMFVDKEPKVYPKSAVAPNLKLTAERLQYTWTPRWLADPQTIMPGANMPNFFDMETNFSVLDIEGDLIGGDMHKGMEAINHYLILSGKTYKGAETARR